MPAPLLIGSEIYRRSTYGPKHPLAIPRVSTALDLIRALGWLDAARYIDSPRATPEALARFHHPEYVAALQRAEAEGRADPADRERFGIGAHGNPVFRDMLDVLDGLREGGRVVGIVSHVAELRQRIPTRLRVVKGRDGSHVEHEQSVAA